MTENNTQEDSQQECKLQKKRNHYFVDFLKKANWQGFKRKTYKFYSTCKNWWKKHKDTRRNVILQFLVALIAVYIAFRLNGCYEQKILNKATKQKLHLTYLESQYNIAYAKLIIDLCADANHTVISINRLDASAAVETFQDSNISIFLPLHKVSLLRSYVNSIDALNQSLQFHQGVLLGQNFRNTKQEKKTREKVRSNAIDVVTMAFMIQEEFKMYYDKSSLNQKESDRIGERIKYIKEKVMKGEVSLSKEL